MGIDQQQRIRVQSLNRQATALNRHAAVLCLVSLVVALTQRPAAAQFPAIELSAVSRAVGQAASTFPIRVSAGTQLDEVNQLVFTHPGITAVLKTAPPRLLESAPQPQFGQFDVTVSPDVPPGIYELRAQGRFGLSNPRSFLVTSNPVQLIEQEHSSPETAAELSVQQIAIDRFQPQRRQFYQLALGPKQKVRIVAHGRKLDSRAVVSLVLINPLGQEVARGRAIGEFPARIDYDVDVQGNYRLVAYDFLYQGGDDFHFALQACVAPADGTDQPDCELERLGASELGIAPLAVAAANGIRPRVSDPTAVSAQWIGGVAPSDLVQQPGAVTIPFTALGNFEQSKSVSYDFQGAAGQQLWIEVNSAQLDQLTEPRMVLYKVNVDAAGKETLQQLLEQDDAATIGGPAMRIRLHDPYATFKIPDEARYRLVVIDNAAGTRPAGSLNFLVSVREPRPTFSLLAYQPLPTNNAAVSKQVATNLFRGGTEAVHVLVHRKDGFGDAIELRAEGLPGGVTCNPVIIPAAVNDATLVLQAAEDAPEWTGAFQVIGKSLGVTPVEQTAVSGTIVRGAVPTRNAVESRLSAGLMLRVNPHDTAPVFVSLGEGQVIEMARAGKLPFVLHAARRAGGTTRCLLRPQNLPPKTTLGEIAIEADKNEANGELQIAPDAIPGEYTFWMQNEAKVKWRNNPQSLAAAEEYIAKLKAAVEDPGQAAQKTELEAALKGATEKLEPLKQATAEKEINTFTPSTPVRIRILESPFRTTIPAITGKPETDQEVEVKIERLFGFAEPVSLSLSGNAPIEGLVVTATKIEAGADAAKLMLKIPAGAAGAITTLPIKLDYTFGGQALSQTVSVELKVEAAAAAPAPAEAAVPAAPEAAPVPEATPAPGNN